VISHSKRERSVLVEQALGSAHSRWQKPISTSRRFWSKVDFFGSVPAHNPVLGACWEWRASKTKGYGKILHDGILCYAHRVAFELRYAHKPSLLILHKCDNKKCVRPDHLYEGTCSDNTRDAYARGLIDRMHANRPRGSSHGNAKLSPADVIEIRSCARYRGSQRDLALRFGVSASLIKQIRTGKAWRDVCC
jgi:hypothetical protein